MASSQTDYFGQTRPAIRSRNPSNLASAGIGPGPPRTPLLARSISSQFGSPSASFRQEQEESVIYELGARHLSAGFAGEGRPRCILSFGPEDGRRVADFRSLDPGYERKANVVRKEEDWGAEHELYRTDIRSLDLGLVEDKLERAVRKAHVDHLQLSNKPLKAVLAVPSLLPTPLLEIALRVLFNHHAQPPAVTILTTPVLACVGAGVRHALVVEIGWEETVVTAIGEYKEVLQRRCVRAGKMLTREMAKVIGEEVKTQQGESEVQVSLEYAEEVTQRMGWCRPREQRLADREGASDSENDEPMPKVSSEDASERPTRTPQDKTSPTPIRLPHPTQSNATLTLPFSRLSNAAETTLFTPSITSTDDHETPLPELLYSALLALPMDLRAVCMSRIIFAGGVADLPGLKHRILQDLQCLIESRGWDPVRSYGSATAKRNRILAERSANTAKLHPALRHDTKPSEEDPYASSTYSVGVDQSPKGVPPGSQAPLPSPKSTKQEVIPTHLRPQDDTNERIVHKAERSNHTNQKSGGKDVVKGLVRGVQTLGAWSGASLVAGLRVKGVWEVEREEFLRNGLGEGVGG